jgi:hypothetical protein
MDGPTETSDPPVKQRRQSALSSAPAHARASVRRTERTVEVEVVSDTAVGVGAMPPVLVIGDRAFGRSRYPADGNPKVLIFTIDPKDFDQLADNSEISLGVLGHGPVAPPDPGSLSGPRIRSDQVRTALRVGIMRTNPPLVQP